MYTTKKETIVNASAKEVFNIISNHVDTPSWVTKVKEVRLIKEGTIKNGLGAIREVEFKPKFWTTIKEVIVSFEENRSYTYKILEGMPGLKDHLGKWSIEAIDNERVKVSWTVGFTFKRFHPFNLFAKGFVSSFGKVQEEALDGLAKALNKN